MILITVALVLVRQGLIPHLREYPIPKIADTLVVQQQFVQVRLAYLQVSGKVTHRLILALRGVVVAPTCAFRIRLVFDPRLQEVAELHPGLVYASMSHQLIVGIDQTRNDMAEGLADLAMVRRKVPRELIKVVIEETNERVVLFSSRQPVSFRGGKCRGNLVFSICLIFPINVPIIGFIAVSIAVSLMT